MSGHSGVGPDPYSYNITIDSCIFSDIGRVAYSGDKDSVNYGHDHGIYSQGRYWVIRNNLFYRMHAGWGIKFDGHYGEATNSTHVVLNNTFAFPTNPAKTITVRR